MPWPFFLPNALPGTKLKKTTAGKMLRTSNGKFTKDVFCCCPYHGGFDCCPTLGWEVTIDVEDNTCDCSFLRDGFAHCNRLCVYGPEFCTTQWSHSNGDDIDCIYHANILLDCGPGGTGTITLTINTLFPDGVIAIYRADGMFDDICADGATLSLVDSANVKCQNWPDEITLTPITDIADCP